MALAVVSSGTQSATLDTEHTLDNDTSGKTCVLVVDTGAMVNGDVVILRLKTKVLSGGTLRLAYSAVYAHAQAEPIKYSIPVPANIEIEATLEQTDGTGRSFPWSLLSLD
jgi:hypothetical protein